MYLSENSIKIAVDRLGGPTKAAGVCLVSNATVHNWIKNGCIPDIDKARVVAKLAGMGVETLRRTR